MPPDEEADQWAGIDIEIQQYRDMVIALFKSGKATDDMWHEMAEAVLDASESESSWRVRNIDGVLVRQLREEASNG